MLLFVSCQLSIEFLELDAASPKFHVKNKHLIMQISDFQSLLFNMRNLLLGRPAVTSADTSPERRPRPNPDTSVNQASNVTLHESLMSGTMEELEILSPEKMVNEFRPSRPAPPVAHKILMTNDQLIQMFMNTAIDKIKAQEGRCESSNQKILLKAADKPSAGSSDAATLSATQTIAATAISSSSSQPEQAKGYRIPKKIPLPTASKSQEETSIKAATGGAGCQLPAVMPVIQAPAALSGDLHGTVVHVCSLDEFYITTKSESEQLKGLSQQMNDAYKSAGRKRSPSLSSHCRSVKSFESRLLSSFWACRFTDQNWCRVRIVRITDDRNILILFIDYGNMMFAAADELFPLNCEFAVLPAMAHQCRMSGLMPLPDKGSWSEEQNEYFENCCHCSEGNDLFIRIVTDDASAGNKDGWLAVHEVILSHEDIDCGFTINQQFVDNGMAISDKFVREEAVPGLAATSVLPFKRTQPPAVNPIPAGLESPDHEDDDLFYNDLERFESARNPEEAMMGFTPTYEKTCKFFPAGTCRRGMLCDFKHVMPAGNKFTATDEMSVSVMPGKELEMEQAYIVKITSYAASFVNCCFPAGIIRYEDMTRAQIESMIAGKEDGMIVYQKMGKEMRQFYDKAAAEKRDILPAIGSMIACRIPQQNNLTMRAKVLEPHDEEKLRVECIDTGLQYNVNRINIFALKPQFTLIPAMTRLFRITNPDFIRGMDPESLNRTYYVMKVTGSPDSYDDVAYVTIVGKAGERKDAISNKQEGNKK